MTDVYLSYSRKDKAFVQTLHDALRAEQREIWVDWQAIPLTADWWQEIERGIEGTNTFVFVISPDSIASDICRKEIDHAVKHNKRLVPIVHREGFDMTAVHPMLSKHNWLFFRETDEFDRGFGDLVRAIETDLEYVRSHTRLTERAVEWEGKQRNESFLLRGMDLAGAEDWLVQGASKQPQVTELQGGYIRASRLAETLRQRAEAGRQRAFVVGVGAFALVAAGAAVFAFQQQQEAVAQKQQAQLSAKSLTSLNLLASDLHLESLAEGLKAGDKLKQWEKDVEAGTPTQVKAALQVVYQINERNRLKGHSERVYSVSFSPDGKMIATGSEDKTVKLWDLQGRQLQTLKGHSGGVRSVSFSPDGKTLATGSNDNTVKLWDLQGRELQTLKGHSGMVLSVSFSPDGKTLATGSDDNTAILWNLDLNSLMTLGCDWLHDYRTYNPDGQSDQELNAICNEMTQPPTNRQTSLWQKIVGWVWQR
ncbi:toll/interleukin-1 receptor domain-containing protein [Phormidesmis sp. 146-12]